MVSTASDAPRYRANLQSEVDSATVYRAMAAAEKNPQLASVYVARPGALACSGLALHRRRLPTGHRRRDPRHAGRPPPSARGESLRAAVLGANDGLTSNLALVMGVAGAQLKTAAILITGLSGLLAGAFSMAIGEWISVQSARELYQRQVTTEAAEIRSVPDEEQEELALIYEAKGLPQKRPNKSPSVSWPTNRPPSTPWCAKS